MKFYEHAARLTRDAAFGLHVGEQGSLKFYGILGYVTINSQTSGEALNRWIRFLQIRTKAYKFSLKITGTTEQSVSSDSWRHPSGEMRGVW